ncbi:MAG TPA: BON domain-containing protein [Verrucomicrobiae bacterium]|nr:BON domain-containing protein [Verrucomicrobiae bacterium]
MNTQLWASAAPGGDAVFRFEEEAPNNTARNIRDRGGATLTPLDQSEDYPDLMATSRIRRAIMNDRSLSFTAKNVKIVTVNGEVTLRGPVNRQQEKVDIAAAARRIAGPGNVNDQLEVLK